MYGIAYESVTKQQRALDQRRAANSQQGLAKCKGTEALPAGHLGEDLLPQVRSHVPVVQQGLQASALQASCKLICRRNVPREDQRPVTTPRAQRILRMDSCQHTSALQAWASIC